MSNPTTAVVQTQLVGGTDGDIFHDGSALGGWPAMQKIDMAHPIRQIDIFSGWIVDGVTVTYQLQGGSTAKGAHGTSSTRSTVKLSDKETLLAVVGRAGNHSYYKRSVVHQLTFVILDTSNGKVRQEGPFGNEDASNQGEVFHVSGPIALAGYAKNGTDPLGLSGLSFIKASTFE
ncbi:lectin [Gloeophyllum trabeum ATCC 11539]|uniref:Lectin n=1 Tax=Gloeophyllum trabeum (strain ATCC 11539 / FP-39264 / Madison 617) TaxID=670483 RepID=S7RHC3_GLOTA|nr:lectin [Gloeophyllum trabeum ATCC 11539]EPQ53680.1 lectin [Gloeophyllum trabeum ATCC 11539]